MTSAAKRKGLRFQFSLSLIHIHTSLMVLSNRFFFTFILEGTFALIARVSFVAIPSEKDI